MNENSEATASEFLFSMSYCSMFRYSIDIWIEFSV